MARLAPDLLRGTLDFLVLKVLALEPRHAWGIAQRIQQISEQELRVQQGSLYPAFGLGTADPLTYGLVAALLFGSAFAACLPALRQAIGTRPTLALRGA